MSKDHIGKIIAASNRQRHATAQTREPSALNIFKSRRNMPQSNTFSHDGDSVVSAARKRLAAAKTQESTALQIVKSQREMMEMMKQNMAVAQAQLERSQRVVNEAEQQLELAEETGAERRDAVAMVELSPTQVSSYSSTNGSNPDVSLSPVYQDRKPSPSFSSLSLSEASTPIYQARKPSPSLSSLSLSEASTSPREPQLKSQLLNLRPEAKMILREVVMSAILHPSGKVDPAMLERATKVGGISKHAIMNAVEVARMRHRMKQKSSLASQRVAHIGGK